MPEATHNNPKFRELIAKLKEIFQIDRPDLDFGIYRILNARADEISDYLEHRLPQKVKEALRQGTAAQQQEAQAKLDAAVQSVRELGMDPEASPKVQELREQLALYDTGTSEHENQVFSHLLTFFSRYYDQGDFISQRRYKGDTYAIPYAGEEVVLHWANKDQYYTKSGENFSNYAFRVPEEGSGKPGRTVHFRLMAADTAKDNRKDNDTARCFVLATRRTVTRTDEEGEAHEEEILPIEEITSEDGSAELVIRFDYAAQPKGSKQAELVAQAVQTILADERVAARWLALGQRLPTEANPTRTLLEKQLTDYTTKNTADYFIHKDLGGFLRRELDFYIKTEVMHLDDVQNAAVFADIEKQLRMIQCLRAIALELIAFLAQLEDFQKKLWLKKKFVVSADYCITLDRVPEALYPEIAANEAQWQQWKDLGVWDGKARDDLKNHPYWMVDTSLFPVTFKHKLLYEISDLDVTADGLLICSDNFQALNLLQDRYREQIQSIYIDPPYNTGDDGFVYKDNFPDSSWITMMRSRASLAKSLMRPNAFFQCSISDVEFSNCEYLISSLFGPQNHKTIVIKMATASGVKMASVIRLETVPKLKEYLLVASNDKFRNYKIPKIDKKDWDSEYRFYILGLSDKDLSTLKDGLEDSGSKLDELDRIAARITLENVNTVMERNGIVADNKRKWLFANAHRIVQVVSVTHGLREIIYNKSTSNSNEFMIVNSSRGNRYLVRRIDNGASSRPRTQLMFAEDNLQTHPGDFWQDISTTSLDNEGGVTFKNGKKPLKLIERILVSSSAPGDVVLDYFAGSGTTIEAIIRQWDSDSRRKKIIAVEADFDTFERKLLVRLQKSVCVNAQSAAFKTLKLESYEDTLNNLQLRRSKTQDDLLNSLEQPAQDDYLLHYLLDVESRGSLLSVADFRKPFDYELKVAVDSAGAWEKRRVDLVETFNYLIGLTVEHIDAQIARGFLTVTGTLPGGEKCLVLWRDCEKLDYEGISRVCDKLAINPADSEFDVVYINGDHNIPTVLQQTEEEGEVTRTLKLRQIEPEFLERMFSVEDV